MLATVDNFGHVFNIFYLKPDFMNSENASVQHLYCLRRGETESSVNEINFSFDSRLVAFTTQKDTTHIFPIQPLQSCDIGLRTHSVPKTVNRTTDYERSSGLLKLEQDHWREHVKIVDAVILLRSQIKTTVSLFQWSSSSDSIFVMNKSGKMIELSLLVESETVVRKPLKFLTKLISDYDLKRKPEWPSVTPALSKMSPLILASEVLTSKSDFEFHTNHENSAVESFLENLFSYKNKESAKRVRTSSWNKQTARESESTDELITPKMPLDWLKHIETLTCECDKRALNRDSQFNFVISCKNFWKIIFELFERMKYYFNTFSMPKCR